MNSASSDPSGRMLKYEARVRRREVDRQGLPSLSRDEVVDGVVAPKFAFDHRPRGCGRLGNRFGADRLGMASERDHRREACTRQKAGKT